MTLTEMQNNIRELGSQIRAAAATLAAAAADANTPTATLTQQRDALNEMNARMAALQSAYNAQGEGESGGLPTGVQTGSATQDRGLRAMLHSNEYARAFADALRSGARPGRPMQNEKHKVLYSNANIRENTLLEALQSPIFMAYHDGQPFNDNMLRPCPMLENPEMLREIVEKTGAHSTDPQSPETAEHLCGKCDDYAKNWMPTAERLWACSHNCASCPSACGKEE